MKIGVSVKIDVNKIDKSRLYKGAKGTYLDLTTFININEVDQYDNNGFISQSMTKEERSCGSENTPILGNVKVFYNDQASVDSMPKSAPAKAEPEVADFDDDIPF